MVNTIKYLKENEAEFFNKIEQWTDENKFLNCIIALLSIPKEERTYKISYQLARAYQNFAIIGEDELGTEYELGTKLLEVSLKILKSIKLEGENKAEWNMRMAYGYQYLEGQEEKAIPYALAWAELKPNDENALLVAEECRLEVEKRRLLRPAIKKVREILREYNIKKLDDYYSREDEEFEAMEEKIIKVFKEYPLEEEEIFDTLDEVLENLENKA